MRRLKIVSWNCNGGFRKKIPLIEALSPDIAIICECEDFERNEKNRQSYKQWAFEHSGLWAGGNRNRGVGVFSFNGYRLEKNESPNSIGEVFLPFTLIRDEKRADMLAVWTKPLEGVSGLSYSMNNDRSLKAFQNSGYLSDCRLLAGDLNSCAGWSSGDRPTHEELEELLLCEGLSSAWKMSGVEQGKEPDTWYMYRKENGTAICLDYAFARKGDYVDLELGGREWLEHSDHLPLTITLNIG